MSKRTIVYVDGFNLYYGLLRHNAACKWLDLWKLSKSLVSPDNDIIAVKYFTSRVNYDPRNPSSKEHQEIYLRALQKIGTVEIVEGYYQRQDARKITIENIKIHKKNFRNTNTTRVARLFMLFHSPFSFRSLRRNHLMPIFCSYTAAFLLEITAAPPVTKPT